MQPATIVACLDDSAASVQDRLSMCFEKSAAAKLWDPYAVRRGGCLELYYCNMVEWFCWDSSLIFDDQLVSFSALTLWVLSFGL